MNLLFVIILFVTHQNTTSAQSLSELVHLYHYAETQIQEIRSNVQTLMESVAIQQKKIMGEMYHKCLSYVNQGLQKLDQLSNVDSNAIQNKIFACSDEVNTTLANTSTQVLGLMDESQLMLDTVIEQLKREPLSDDLDQINDEIDDIVEDFKESLEEKINPAFETLLRQSRTISVSLPLKVKKCIDEVFK